MSIISISMIGIITALMAITLKGIKSEYGSFLAVTSCMIIFFFGISKLKVILQIMKRIQEYIHIDPIYFALLLKMAGITYLADFAAGICKDAGYSAIATQIEIFGKLSVLVVSLPILLALMETIQKFLPS